MQDFSTCAEVMDKRPTDQEIEEQLDKAVTITMEDKTIFHGMTYEQGVETALRWCLDKSSEIPIDGNEQGE